MAKVAPPKENTVINPPIKSMDCFLNTFIDAPKPASMAPVLFIIPNAPPIINTRKIIHPTSDIPVGMA